MVKTNRSDRRERVSRLFADVIEAVTDLTFDLELQALDDAGVKDGPVNSRKKKTLSKLVFCIDQYMDNEQAWSWSTDIGDYEFTSRIFYGLSADEALHDVKEFARAFGIAKIERQFPNGLWQTI